VQQIQDTDIRYVKEEDYPEIVELTRLLVQIVLPEEIFEEDKIKKLFDSALENKDFTGIVLSISGVIKGFIFGFLSEHYFHSKNVAYCMAIYVSEDSRKYGLEMLRSFEAWGKYKQAKTLCISSFNNLSPDTLKTVYKRLGYTEKEIIYWKEV